MVKLYGVLMAVSIMLLLLACAPRAAPVAAPTTVAPQAALPLPAPVAPVISAEETDWQKVVVAAKREGRLTMYISFLFGDVVMETFRRQTGVVAENVSAPPAAIVERIKAERRAAVQTADLLGTSISDLLPAKDMRLLQPMGYLPSLADGAAWSKKPHYDGEGYIITPVSGIQGPWINTNLVKPGEEPRSWRDLLQPQWKGKIDATDPALGPQLMRMFYYLTKHGGLDEAYFQQLGKQVSWTPTSRMGADKVARGEMSMMVFTATTVMGKYILEGAPVKAIDLEEGVVGMQPNPWSLLEGAPHPNAARLFMNWLLSKEGQTLYHKDNGSQSLRKDVPNFEPPPARLSPKRVIWTTPEEEMEVAKLFLDRRVAKLMKGP